MCVHRRSNCTRSSQNTAEPAALLAEAQSKSMEIWACGLFNWVFHKRESAIWSTGAGCLLIESVPKIKLLSAAAATRSISTLGARSRPYLSLARTNYRSRSAALAQIRSAREGCIICRGALANGFRKEAPLLAFGGPLICTRRLLCSWYPKLSCSRRVTTTSVPVCCQNWLQMNAFGFRDKIIGRQRETFKAIFWGIAAQ